MISWRVSQLLGTAICRIFEKIRKILVCACLSPSYTSDWLFSELRLLAIIGLPWPMTAGDNDNDNNDGNRDCITRDERITGGCHGSRAPWGQTATVAALACRRFNVVVVAKRSGAVRKCANARAFKRHQRANGRGRRDDIAAMVAPVATSTTAVADDDGNADCDNILCLTNLYIIFIHFYHYVDCANHAFGGPNHDDSVRVDAPTTTHTPQPSSTTC